MVRILVVQHEAAAPAGWLGEWLVEEGCTLHVSRPYAGDVLPERLEGYDGLLVLGGAMDAWDDAGYPWLARTRDLVRDAEGSGRPVLGICLGHQIATLALGGEVGRNPAGPAIGVLDVGWADEVDDPLLGAVATARHAVHWNDDVALALPRAARLLAVTADGAVQAARLGRWVWGLQCHPEAGPAIIRRWAAEDPDGLARRGVDAALLVQDVERHAGTLAVEWRPLAEAFAGTLRTAAGRVDSARAGARVAGSAAVTGPALEQRR